MNELEKYLVRFLGINEEFAKDIITTYNLNDFNLLKVYSSTIDNTRDIILSRGYEDITYVHISSEKLITSHYKRVRVRVKSSLDDYVCLSNNTLYLGEDGEIYKPSIHHETYNVLTGKGISADVNQNGIAAYDSAVVSRGKSSIPLFTATPTEIRKSTPLPDVNPELQAYYASFNYFITKSRELDKEIPYIEENIRIAM